MSNFLEKALDNPLAIAYVIEGGLKGAMGCLEEYRIGKRNLEYNDLELTKNLEKYLKEAIKNFVDELPLKEKIVVKAALALPWSTTTKILYDSLLEFGSTESEKDKTTIDAVVDGIKKYFGV